MSRYTEKEIKAKGDGILEEVKDFFLSIILSPYRLINEISQKIMYLDKDSVEKLGLGSLLLATGMLMLDAIIYLVGGNDSYVTGSSPLLIKFISVVVLGYFLIFLLSKMKLRGLMESGEYYVGAEDIPGDEEEEAEEEEEEDYGYREEEKERDVSTEEEEEEEEHIPPVEKDPESEIVLSGIEDVDDPYGLDAEFKKYPEPESLVLDNLEIPEMPEMYKRNLGVPDHLQPSNKPVSYAQETHVSLETESGDNQTFNEQEVHNPDNNVFPERDLFELQRALGESDKTYANKAKSVVEESTLPQSLMDDLLSFKL